MAKKPIQPMYEGSSGYIKLRLKDHDEVALTSVATMTMRLHDMDSDAVINSQDGTDIASSFDATLLPTYNVALLLNPLDNPMIGTNNSEYHVLTLTFTYLSGSDTITRNASVWIKVAGHEYI